MKDLYFFTSSYPFSHDYIWKRNELIELQNHFNVTVVPFYYQKNNQLTNVPEKITVKSPIFREIVKGKWIHGFRTIFTPRFFYYYREFLRKKVYLKKIWTLKWLASVMLIEGLLKEPIIKSFLRKKDQNKNSILYFYWGVGITNIIPFMKNLGYEKIIVRFHAFDLYEDRRNGYIPFRIDMLKGVDYAIFISNHGKTYLHDRYPKININSKIFRLGSKKNGQSKPSNDSILRIVSCSNVIPLKRVTLIAQAVKQIDFKLEWTHFGDGELFEELENLVKALPNNINVTLTGRISPDEVLDYYSKNYIDLFLNVSTTEGVPVSVMEAFSAGIPVYATRVGGTPEIVDDSNGKLLDKNLTATELGRLINEFYQLDKEKKFHYRRAALETYKTKCDFNSINKQFVKFLNN